MQKIRESITTILVLRPRDLSWIEHVYTSRSDLVKSLISRMKTTLGTKQFILEPWTLFSMEKPCHNVFFYDAVYLHCITSIVSPSKTILIHIYEFCNSYIHSFHLWYKYMLLFLLFYIERYARSKIILYFFFLSTIFPNAKLRREDCLIKIS